MFCFPYYLLGPIKVLGGPFGVFIVILIGTISSVLKTRLRRVVLPQLCYIFIRLCLGIYLRTQCGASCFRILVLGVLLGLFCLRQSVLVLDGLYRNVYFLFSICLIALFSCWNDLVCFDYSLVCCFFIFLCVRGVVAVGLIVAIGLK